VANHSIETELLKLCPLVDKRGPETSPPTHTMVIDFIAMGRKVPLKKLNPPVQTFCDFAATSMSIITRVGLNCDREIHIVFYSYREDSIKNAEQKRRGKNKDMIVPDVVSPDQNVPVLLENFWSFSVAIFVHVMTPVTYKLISKKVGAAILQQIDILAPIPSYFLGSNYARTVEFTPFKNKYAYILE